MNQPCLATLPTLVLNKIIKLLDVKSIAHLSQTTSAIRLLIQQDYQLGLKICSNDYVGNRENKSVLRLEINFLDDMSCRGTGKTQNASVNNILQQLKLLELRNIVELTVRFCTWNEDLISQLKTNMSDLQNKVKSMKNMTKCKLIISSKAKANM